MQLSGKRSLLIASVAFVCACLLYSDVYGQDSGSRDSSNSFTSLEWLPDTGNSGTVANSSSVLIRNENGLRIRPARPDCWQAVPTQSGG